jgi:hypothetical protein
MVQPENIDSGHSNFQLGASSGRYHHNLARLRTNVTSRKSYTEPGPFKPTTRNFNWVTSGHNRPTLAPDRFAKFWQDYGALTECCGLFGVIIASKRGG